MNYLSFVTFSVNVSMYYCTRCAYENKGKITHIITCTLIPAFFILRTEFHVGRMPDQISSKLLAPHTQLSRPDVQSCAHVSSEANCTILGEKKSGELGRHNTGIIAR